MADFPGIARKAFFFLEEMGFRFTESDQVQLRYETAKVIVTVNRDPRIGELTVYTGLKPENRAHRAFLLEDILAMQKVLDRDQPFQVYKMEDVEPFLIQLAKELKAHARPALAGDKMFFRRLEILRSSKSSELVRSMTNSPIRTKAEVAWHAKDYRTVIELYSSIEPQLEESEKAKLEYARKHLE